MKIQELIEAKQRLDPKCWKGYKKQGTKMKGGVRVNNCVPESAEQGVAEGAPIDTDWYRKQQERQTKAKQRQHSVAEGGFKNKTAVFSGYSNYMRSRAPNVFNQLGIKVLNKEYFEDEDIIEYTVISDGDSLAKARATLETNPQFGGMVLKKGTTESIDADQKKAKQVPSTEMPKKTSPVLGKAPKQHPFKGRAVGGGL